MATKYLDSQPHCIILESDDDSEDVPELTESRELLPSDVSEEKVIPLIKQEKCINDDAYEHGCYSCSIEKPIEDIQDIKPGKHLTRNGAKTFFGRFYKHHLLCTGIQYLSGNKALVTLIHKAPQNEGRKKDAKVHKATITIDINSDKYNLVVYTNPKYTDEKIVQRAEQLLLECEEEETCRKNGVKTKRYCNYNLLLRNCEHFVTFCTTGHDESKQVYKFFSKFQGICKQGFSVPNEIVILMNYLDTVSTTITTGIGGVGIVFSILVFLWHVAKLIHTKCRKSLCRFCKNKKMRNYGIDIFFLLCEIGLSYVLIWVCSFAFWQGLLVGLGLALGIIFIKWFIKKMLTIFSRPRYTTSNVSDISILEPGDIIEYKSWLIKHLGVIVDIQQFENKKQLSLIHYGLNNPFSIREIILEKIMFSNSNPRLKKVDFFEKPHFENEEVVSRAISRLRERKWNSMKNTSFHFCHWCKVNSMEEGIEFAQDTE